MSGASVVAVLLGTDHHPFPRLLSWVQGRQADGGATWFVQHGATTLPPGVPGAFLLSVDDLHDLLRRADAVVTHGGPGLVMDAIDAGHRPVVVPRLSRLGEHVDDHQVAFARRMAVSGAVVAVDDTARLDAAVRDAIRDRHARPDVARAGSQAAVRRFGVLVDEMVRGA